MLSVLIPLFLSTMCLTGGSLFSKTEKKPVVQEEVAQEAETDACKGCRK